MKKDANKMKTTNVHFILDKSGSMETVRDATISGFNEYVGTLRNDKHRNVRYNMTLTLFDTMIKTVFIKEPIKGVENLDRETYVPGGMTALYDAVCQTIRTGKGDKDKNLVVIMTDGEENSSVEYSAITLKKMMKELEEKGNWTFVFLGSNQDAWIAGQKIGMNMGNVATYNSTAAGVQATMLHMAASTVNFANDSSLSTASYFSDEDKKKLANTK